MHPCQSTWNCLNAAVTKRWAINEFTSAPERVWVCPEHARVSLQKKQLAAA